MRVDFNVEWLRFVARQAHLLFSREDVLVLPDPITLAKLLLPPPPLVSGLAKRLPLSRPLAAEFRTGWTAQSAVLRVADGISELEGMLVHDPRHPRSPVEFVCHRADEYLDNLSWAVAHGLCAFGAPTSEHLSSDHKVADPANTVAWLAEAVSYLGVSVSAGRASSAEPSEWQRFSAGICASAAGVSTDLVEKLTDVYLSRVINLQRESPRIRDIHTTYRLDRCEETCVDFSGSAKLFNIRSLQTVSLCEVSRKKEEGGWWRV